jgi:signal transduction histidine kinase
VSRGFPAGARNLALAGVLVFVGIIGALTWWTLVAGRDARNWVQHTSDVLGVIKDLDIAITDAETGQRGYLLTGNADYLSPYNAARGRVALLEDTLSRLTPDNPIQQDRLKALAPLLQGKLDELAQTIELRRDVSADAALRLVETGTGRALMQQIKAILADMTATETALRDRRIASSEQLSAIGRGLAVAGCIVSLVLLAAAARLLRRSGDQLIASETEQRELARELRASLDSISQGVGVFDASWHLVRRNQSLPQLLTLPEEMVREGTPYAALTDHLSAAAVGGVPLLESEDQVRHGHPLGSIGAPILYQRARQSDGRSFEFRRTAMLGGGFVLTVADITERTRVEGVLRDAQRMQAMGQLTGGIAHDFNNLLAVIIGNLELAARRFDPDDPVSQRLDRAMWGAQRGAELTRQLLAFARKQPLAPQTIDVSAMLSEIAGLLRRTLGERVEMCVVDSAGLWPVVADPAQLESAILNLAINARDAMPDGGRLTIEVANKVLDDDYARQHTEVVAGDYVMIAVSDTGTGMPPDILARVFEPFFTTKGPDKGTGLGLSMVFGFVKQSSGHISIYSEPGQGTTVRLYLPRAVGAIPSSSHRISEPVLLPRGSGTVLVVEDEANLREVACAVLQDLGYTVLEAANGEEALRLVDADKPSLDLVLIDVVLPGAMNGRELASRLAELQPGLRVLFMSGYTENAIVHQGRLDGGVMLLGKPFSREQLARKVADALRPR